MKHVLALACALALLATACGSDAADTATSAADQVAEAGSTEAESAEAGSTEVEPTEAMTDAGDDAGQTASTGTTGAGLDVDRFFDGALTEAATTAACTLADGTEADCYQLTIAGYPADTEIGPFCPTTTSATAEEAGIWLDGDQVYDLDGEFILDLANIYGDDNWLLHDADGHVHITDTQEAFEAAARPDVDPEYQNHCVEGRIEWLDGGEPVTSSVEIPAVPTASGSASSINGSIGVTLNGVIIDGSAPVDAILGAYTIAAFDDCGGHVNPVAGYHLHGATGCSESADPGDGDTPAFAYALDGYAIHSPLTDDQTAAAGLDECNGHVSEASGYHYHANQAALNAVLTCFTGTTTADNAQSGRRGR